MAEPVLRHIVLLKLAEANEAALAELENDLRALVASVPGCARGEVHRDLGLRSGSGRAADLCAELFFEDEAAFEAYLAGAPHTTFLRRHLPHLRTLLAAQVMFDVPTAPRARGSAER